METDVCLEDRAGAMTTKMKKKMMMMMLDGDGTMTKMSMCQLWWEGW